MPDNQESPSKPESTNEAFNLIDRFIDALKESQQALGGVKNTFKDALAAIEIRRGEIGAIDGYSYDSGVEYGLRLASIKLEAALAAIKE